MVSAAQAAPAAERVDFRRLLWVGPLAIAAAVIANVIIRFVAVAALQPDPAPVGNWGHVPNAVYSW